MSFMIIHRSLFTDILLQCFYFYFKHMLLIILLYCYLSKILNSGLLLIMEYFYTVVLVPLLK